MLVWVTLECQDRFRDPWRICTLGFSQPPRYWAYFCKVRMWRLPWGVWNSPQCKGESSSSVPLETDSGQGGTGKSHMSTLGAQCVRNLNYKRRKLKREGRVATLWGVISSGNHRTQHNGNMNQQQNPPRSQDMGTGDPWDEVERNLGPAGVVWESGRNTGCLFISSHS